jgi:hypothetical protein
MCDDGNAMVRHDHDFEPVGKRKVADIRSGRFRLGGLAVCYHGESGKRDGENPQGTGEKSHFQG